MMFLDVIMVLAFIVLPWVLFGCCKGFDEVPRGMVTVAVGMIGGAVIMTILGAIFAIVHRVPSAY